jgi:hypothetical protein
LLDQPSRQTPYKYSTDNSNSNRNNNNNNNNNNSKGVILSEHAKKKAYGSGGIFPPIR